MFSLRSQAGMPLALILYRLSVLGLWPFFKLALRWRILADENAQTRFSTSLGHGYQRRPLGRLVWLHGASLGEVKVLLPLMEKINAHYTCKGEAAPNFLLSYMSSNADAFLKQLALKNCYLSYAPADHPRVVSRFLAHWQPDIAFFAESELWPHLIIQSHQAHIPLILLNARMSKSSLKRWQFFKTSTRVLCNCFSLILCAERHTYTVLRPLTQTPIHYIGNLKTDISMTDMDKITDLSRSTKKQTVILFASTHKQEEHLFANLCSEIHKAHPDAYIIWAPRHCARAHPIVKLLQKRGLTSELHTQTSWAQKSDAFNPLTTVFIMDALGKMPSLYTYSTLTIMGGSWHKTLSGHNPMETLLHKSPLICGPFVDSFKDIYHDLVQTQACKQLTSARELTDTVNTLLNNSQARVDMNKQAQAYANAQKPLYDICLDMCIHYLNTALMPTTILQKKPQSHDARA